MPPRGGRNTRHRAKQLDHAFFGQLSGKASINGIILPHFTNVGLFSADAAATLRSWLQGHRWPMAGGSLWTVNYKKLPFKSVYWCTSPYLRPRPRCQEWIEQPAHKGAFVGDDIGLEGHTRLQGFFYAVSADAGPR
jgi:hypothetical protein